MCTVLEVTMHTWDPAFIWRGVAVKGKSTRLGVWRFSLELQFLSFRSSLIDKAPLSLDFLNH